MPIRFLRPGLRTSKRFNRVSWFAQSLYMRLITVVDDHGRYEADPQLLASELFPFGNPTGKQARPKTVAGALMELCKAGLVLLYSHEDKEYLQITRWQERVRGKSKFPTPPCEHLPANDSNCAQLTANARLLSLKPSPSPSPSPSPKLQSLEALSLPAHDKATKATKLSKSEKFLAERFESALDGQWTNDAGKWVNRIKSDQSKAERVIAEVELAAREGRIRTTPAQYAEQAWQEFCST